MSEQRRFELNTTTKIEYDGMVTIKCNKGLWKVSSLNKYWATLEAMPYFTQYERDGEYDEH